MWNSGDNEFIHSACSEAIRNGILKITQEELDSHFDDESVKKSKELNKKLEIEKQ